MAAQEGAVYCTLLLSDNYLPGAVVLGHSLRDNGTRAKLVALYTPDTLQTATINELQAVYDELIPVHRMTNHTPANLWLMERPDLIATFTKIELWRQTQFKRIVYIDSDVVSIRAPDELLELDVDFAAVPDVGWPDCFNSGVMVLRPNLQDYFALKDFAERGTSFDGADQGLLNIHFRDWHRLSFTYNCTPSANYQYIPAYKHFQSTISLIHFIGSQKPWNMPRQTAPFDSPFNQLLGRWWTVYDRHYRPAVLGKIQSGDRTVTLHARHADETQLLEFPPLTYTTVTSFAPVSDVQAEEQRLQPEPLSDPQPEDHVREEGAREATHASHNPGPSSVAFPAEWSTHRYHSGRHEEHVNEPAISVVPLYVHGEEHVKAYVQNSHRVHTSQLVTPPQTQEPSGPSHPVRPPEHSHFGDHHSQVPAVETQQAQSSQPLREERIFEAPQAEWNAAREPPPLHSKPEGIALESKTYTMSQDHQLFQPPASYPEAPKNMYYQVPATKPQSQKLAQIFPWEAKAPKPTRVFPAERRQLLSTASPVATEEESREPQSSRPTSWTSEIPYPPSESWDTYTRSNAWDEVPGIQEYIQSIQQARKARVQVITGGPSKPSKNSPSDIFTQTPISRSKSPGTGSGTAIRITDFPSEIERPSLPVTPAPIHRAPITGSPNEYTTARLPAAEGVPSQEDWNPSARLEDLRRRQDDLWRNPDSLLERLARAVEKDE